MKKENTGTNPNNNITYIGDEFAPNIWQYMRQYYDLPFMEKFFDIDDNSNNIKLKKRKMTNIEGDSSPKINFIEYVDKYIIELGLAGWNREDLSVSINDNVLKVTGFSTRQTSDENQNLKVGIFHQKELIYDSFTKLITLGSNIKQSNVEAEYRDGILTITIPKLFSGTKNSGQSIPIK